MSSASRISLRLCGVAAVSYFVAARLALLLATVVSSAPALLAEPAILSLPSPFLIGLGAMLQAWLGGLGVRRDLDIG